MAGDSLSFRYVSLIILTSLVSAALGAPTPDFVTEVRPIFERHCLNCHGPDRQKSGYRLDVSEIALKGGDKEERPILPHDSKRSPLIRYVSGDDVQMSMPPPKSKSPPLTRAEVATLRAWIDAGAAWPESASAKVIAPLDWWSLKPVAKPTVPVGGQNPIDAFISQKLAEKHLKLSSQAEARTLCRRLYFDLIGLPPSPQEMDQFEQSLVQDSTAYEKLVDKLLASPRYGERWARYWLDVVHYGDTHGYDKDKPRPNAWPYRDYVIRALNDDKPYARFVQEQLAGDVLFPNTRDGIEGLGFIAAGPWDFIGHAEVSESKVDGKIARHLDRDDMVGNAIGTFCSTTVQCAQCHNHKFDPISQEDYYCLQAVFAALDRTDRKYYRDDSVNARFQELSRRQTETDTALALIDEQLKAKVGDRYIALSKTIDAASKTPAQKQELAHERESMLLSFADDAIKKKRGDLKLEKTRIDTELHKLPAPSLVYAGGVHTGNGAFAGTGANGGKPRPIYLLARGQVTLPGKEVHPGAISALNFAPGRFSLPPAADESERRAALAKWVTDEHNPLTWRSIVNRVWQYHFGRGLVSTSNDFGRMGAMPTHPELLDWLAVDFRENGGSLKRLHKQIVMSLTYQQSSAGNPKAELMDTSNTLLWRQNRRKLEAEALHDAVLAVSGALDLTMGGPGWQDFVLEHPEHSPHYEYDKADPRDVKTWRRSIYRFIVRSQMQPFMTALDCADPSMRVDKRNESISPAQALALLNNGFMVTQSVEFATRAEREFGPSLPAQVDGAFRLALGRSPSSVERDRLNLFAREQGMPNLCRVLFNLNEFIFVD